MKYKYILFAIASIFLSCNRETPSDSIADKIKQVESSLSNPVYFEGDSTWTIEERMKHYGVPGVSIAVIYDGRIAWTKQYGVMDKESQKPVDSLTLFQAGSISKPVAAYGALRLVDQNKINLDADVNNYLESWKLPDSEFTKEKKVAMKHLLNHSGGLTVHGFLGYSPDLPVPSLVQVLKGEAPANSPTIFVDKVPEESFRYSGGGYCIAQQMMIDIEGKPFPQIMTELVLQPLGMENSSYDQPLNEPQLSFAATGYLPDGSQTKGKRHTYPEMAAAGLWTTAGDLAKFAIDLQETNKGASKKVLTQATANKMLTPFVEDFVGLGIFINKKKDETYFGHGGWDEGFSSELIAHKDKGYGVVILTNSNHPDFISELIRSVAISYKWDNFVPTYEQLNLDPIKANEITGRYRINNDRFTHVFLDDNKLYRKSFADKPIELIRISDSSYVTRQNEQIIQFKLNAETGDTELLIINPNDGTVETRRPRLQPGEILPIELLESGEFDKALKAYEALLKKDPKDEAISENNINRSGYRLLSENQLNLAQALFKINTLLYPKSANVYDSYAEACMKNGDNDLAIINYKKSLALDPKNENAVKTLKELEKKPIN